MATAKKKPAKCRTCGGYCGKKRGQRCQFSTNEARRRAGELWSALTAGMRQKGDE
ncbi:hypothetical protein [Chromobacterium violaceum]|uniref:hypothetical protein n=1 Tax=Chromobacterium violaceum TaxID=536 RepID=UPI0015951BFD|nr:hypothetical protein [Chromobacterium violaceum]